MSEMVDVLVIGGGFAGVTAAREAALRGRSVRLLEARDRLGGRTWSSTWEGHSIEYGGAWVHWHQPHTFSELTRAGLSVTSSDNVERAGWWVGDELREGTIPERDAIAERGWNQFVDGVREALPQPHAPLYALPELARFDRLTIAERIDQLTLSEEERAVLVAELESLAHGSIDEAGAVAVLRWHALSGYTLRLTQETGGQVLIDRGTGALLAAIAGAAPVDIRLGSPVAAISVGDDGVGVSCRDGSGHRAGAVVVAAPLNTLGAIEFTPALPDDKQSGIALGQASRGIKLMLRAQGPAVSACNIRGDHPFGYLASQELCEDGTQLMIGFGPDANRCDSSDLAAVQHDLDELMPGYRALAATSHDWLADEFSRGTWAIHRPGWYEHHLAAMQRPEGRLAIAGSDLANGWSGFIDGAIESGLRAGIWAAAVR